MTGRRATDTKLDRALRALQVITSIGAIAGLVVATIAILLAVNARRESAHDSCELLRGLVYAATTHAPRQRAAANAYIQATPLRNCNDYARRLVP